MSVKIQSILKSWVSMLLFKFVHSSISDMAQDRRNGCRRLKGVAVLFDTAIVDWFNAVMSPVLGEEEIKILSL